MENDCVHHYFDLMSNITIKLIHTNQPFVMSRQAPMPPHVCHVFVSTKKMEGLTKHLLKPEQSPKEYRNNSTAEVSFTFKKDHIISWINRFGPFRVLTSVLLDVQMEKKISFVNM